MNQFATRNSSNLLATSIAFRELDAVDVGIGYAIVQDLDDLQPAKQGQRDNSRAALEILRERIIAQNGTCCKTTVLARRRQVAIAFPRGSEPIGVSWTTLESAKSIERWNRVLDALPPGTVPTREQVREVLKPLDQASRAEKRAKKTRAAQEEIDSANEVLASSVLPKEFARAQKIRDRAIARLEAPPRQPRAPRLKTLLSAPDRAARIASDAEATLINFAEEMSADDRHALFEKWQHAANACAAIVRVLATSDEEAMAAE